MTNRVPDSTQLSKLPLRAMVAYASRAARRVVAGRKLRYVKTCDGALDHVDDFVRLPSVNAEMARRSANSAAAVAHAESLDEVGRELRVGLAVRAALMCCYYAVTAVVESELEPTNCRKRAAAAAARAVRQLDSLDSELAVADYERLVTLFGENEAIVLGNSFDPSENGPLGRILRDPS